MISYWILEIYFPIMVIKHYSLMSYQFIKYLWLAWDFTNDLLPNRNEKISYLIKIYMLIFFLLVIFIVSYLLLLTLNLGKVH